MGAACQGSSLTPSPVPGFPGAGMEKPGALEATNPCLPTAVRAGQTLLCPVLPIPPAATAIALPLLYRGEAGAFTSAWSLVGKNVCPQPGSVGHTPCGITHQPSHELSVCYGSSFQHSQWGHRLKGGRGRNIICTSQQRLEQCTSHMSSPAWLEDHPSSSCSQTQHWQGNEFL